MGAYGACRGVAVRRSTIGGVTARTNGERYGEEVSEEEGPEEERCQPRQAPQLLSRGRREGPAARATGPSSRPGRVGQGRYSWVSASTAYSLSLSRSRSRSSWGAVS